jgi:hypothetical protein
MLVVCVALNAGRVTDELAMVMLDCVKWIVE